MLKYLKRTFKAYIWASTNTIFSGKRQELEKEFSEFVDFAKDTIELKVYIVSLESHPMASGFSDEEFIESAIGSFNLERLVHHFNTRTEFGNSIIRIL